MKKLILTAVFMMCGALFLFGQEAITVVANGNVGINNTNPTAKLDVNGDTKVNGNSTVTGNVNVGGDAINADLKLTNASSEEILRNILEHLNPVGTIQAYGGINDPVGYLICDGRELDKDDPKYAKLFTVIGYSFGHGTGTKFRIPDLRGQFLRGADLGSGNDPDVNSRVAVDAISKDQPGSTETDSNKQHDHVMSHGHTAPNTGDAGAHNHNFAFNNGSGINVGVASSNQAGSGYSTSTQPNHNHTVTINNMTGNTQQSGGTETRPKNVAVNFVIKY